MRDGFAPSRFSDKAGTLGLDHVNRRTDRPIAEPGILSRVGDGVVGDDFYFAGRQTGEFVGANIASV